MASLRLSLNAMRAFEATARLQSFSAAADELSVTHGDYPLSSRIQGSDLATSSFLAKEADQGPQICIVEALDLLVSNFKDHQQLSL